MSYLCIMWTNLREFFVKAINETRQNITSVCNLLRIFSNNPNQRTTGIWFIKFIDALAQNWNDAFIARILAENVFDNHNSLLNNIINFGCNKVEQRVDAFLARRLNLNCHLSDCANSSTDKVHVH